MYWWNFLRRTNPNLWSRRSTHCSWTTSRFHSLDGSARSVSRRRLQHLRASSRSRPSSGREWRRQWDHRRLVTLDVAVGEALPHHLIRSWRQVSHSCLLSSPLRFRLPHRDRPPRFCRSNWGNATYTAVARSLDARFSFLCVSLPLVSFHTLSSLSFSRLSWRHQHLSDFAVTSLRRCRSSSLCICQCHCRIWWYLIAQWRSFAWEASFLKAVSCFFCRSWLRYFD